MSTAAVPFTTTLHVRDHCLCLHAQRAPRQPPIGAVADLLAMDRSTVTANLKPLERQGLVTVSVDPETGEPHTYHTKNPVPFILVAPDGSPLRYVTLRTGGRLCDISLTVLDIMDLDPAPDMTCQSLIGR